MIRIDPDDGALSVELPHGETITVEGSPRLPVVERGEERALFLSPGEAETLGKMIDYILTQIAKGSLRIRADSEETLRAIRPRLDGVFAE